MPPRRAPRRLAVGMNRDATTDDQKTDRANLPLMKSGSHASKVIATKFAPKKARRSNAAAGRRTIALRFRRKFGRLAKPSARGSEAKAAVRFGSTIRSAR